MFKPQSWPRFISLILTFKMPMKALAGPTQQSSNAARLEVKPCDHLARPDSYVVLLSEIDRILTKDWHSRGLVIG